MKILSEGKIVTIEDTKKTIHKEKWLELDIFSNLFNLWRMNV